MNKLQLSNIRRQLQNSRKDIRWLLYGALLVPSITLIVDSTALLFGLFFPAILPKVGAGLLVTLALLWAYCLLLKNDLYRHKKFLVKYAPKDFDIDSEECFDEGWDDAVKEQKKM